MGYLWPSILQLVVFSLITLLAVIQCIFGVVLIVAGWWPGIGGIIHAVVTVGYTILFFVKHKQSHVTLVTAKWDIIASAVLGVTGLLIGIFYGAVAFGTFSLLLTNAIFVSIYVGTRKISDKWNMTVYDIAGTDATGGNGQKMQDAQWTA